MRAWPAATAREAHDTLDSTNAEALRRASAGASGPLWILARRQTAARGRRGRQWSSPDGNFAATLLITPSGPPQEAALRSFVAALGLFDAVLALTGRPEALALKWPNDVLLSGRKFAGILLETGRPPNRALRLAVGFGVNLVASPDRAALEPGALPPTCLREATGVTVEPEEFLAVLAPEVARWEERLRTGGFGPLRTEWLARAARLGHPLTARLPGRADVTGLFETIDHTGALVLATDDGRVTLSAAEVFFGDRSTKAVRDAAGN